MEPLPLLLGLVGGLAIGGLAAFGIGRSSGRTRGYAEAQRELAVGGLDPNATRNAADAALATALERLAEQNSKHQREFAERAQQEAQRQERTVAGLVDPIDQKLQALDQALRKIEQSRANDQGQLAQAVGTLTQLTTSLDRETRTLATAMKDNKARGTWGEMQLRRVVELAGMIEHCDFITQTTVAGDDGRLRPDLVVQLPQSRAIVVDSKVPMSAYLDAVNAEDPAQRRALLDQHSRDVSAHVTELQRRNYGSYVDGALDFVVMFVPGDTFLEAAFETNASWFEDSIAKGVFPASPGSLIALLRAISYGWRQEQLAESAEEIAELGRELHKRIATMAEKFAGVGTALDRATKSYNETVASLESRVLVTTRQMEAKGVRSAKEVRALERVETTPRPLSAPELVGPDASTDDPAGAVSPDAP